MRLSEKQQVVLDAMKAGATAYFMGGMKAYWFLDIGGHPRITRTIEKLVKLKLIKIVKQDWRGATAKYVESRSAKGG